MLCMTLDITDGMDTPNWFIGEYVHPSAASCSHLVEDIEPRMTSSTIPVIGSNVSGSQSLNGHRCEPRDKTGTSPPQSLELLGGLSSAECYYVSRDGIA